MDTEFLWINAGFVMDEAGSLITTSYIDLRAPEARTAIRTLVKGCRREHALGETEAILASPLERFWEGDENPIRDAQEGLSTEGTETVDPETPEEAADRRREVDMNEVIELLDSGMTRTNRVVKR